MRQRKEGDWPEKKEPEVRKKKRENLYIRKENSTKRKTNCHTEMAVQEFASYSIRKIAGGMEEVGYRENVRGSL